jgi:hypothetical protein
MTAISNKEFAHLGIRVRRLPIEITMMIYHYHLENTQREHHKKVMDDMWHVGIEMRKKLDETLCKSLHPFMAKYSKSWSTCVGCNDKGKEVIRRMFAKVTHQNLMAKFRAMKLN